MKDPAFKNLSGKTRTEHDLSGNREIPDEYYFGIQTLWEVENFDISRASLFLSGTDKSARRGQTGGYGQQP